MKAIDSSYCKFETLVIDGLYDFEFLLQYKSKFARKLRFGRLLYQIYFESSNNINCLRPLLLRRFYFYS